MPKGKPATGRARQKSFSVYMRPYIKETITKRMPVEEGLAYLDSKTKKFKEDWR